MKRVSLLLALVVGVVPSLAQQHAPTIAVCRADVAVWNNQLLKSEYRAAEDAYRQNKTPNRSQVAMLSVHEVSARADEMDDCSKVDTEKEEAYLQATDFYSLVYDERVGHFLTRHKLWEKFFAEDEAGMR
jgi:hypothetical protein